LSHILVVVFRIDKEYISYYEVDMKKVPATRVQNNFGETLESCMTEAVSITKNGREVAVLISKPEYDRLYAFGKRFHGELALIAESCGFMDNEEMHKWIEEKVNATP
jgi:prevent-host-death family protein